MIYANNYVTAIQMECFIICYLYKCNNTMLFLLIILCFVHMFVHVLFPVSCKCTADMP